jgi:hypothetical protein
MASPLRDQHPCPCPLPPSTVFSFTLAVFALSACADRVTAPGDRTSPDVGVGSSTLLGAPPLADRAKPYAGKADDGEPPLPKRHHPHEPPGAASRDATSTKLLSYHGGRVQTAPRIYLIYWGPSWFSAGDPSGVANRLNLFYKGIGGSAYAEALKEYAGKSSVFTNPSTQYKGWRQDTSPVPRHPSQTQIEAVVRRAATQLNDFSYNAQYVIATVWGVSDQLLNEHRWCAWHDWTAAGPTGRWVTFTSMPYMPYLDSLGRRCGGGTVNGEKGELDGVTILAAHEYSESVNDPDFRAWYDSDGDEIADKCSWINLTNAVLRNGYAFPVQPQWSNARRKAEGNGCL